MLQVAALLADRLDRAVVQRCEQIGSAAVVKRGWLPANRAGLPPWAGGAGATLNAAVAAGEKHAGCVPGQQPGAGSVHWGPGASAVM